MCLVGLLLKPQRCSAARLLRSTAPCSGRARRLPNTLRTNDHLWHLPQILRSNNSSAAISRLTFFVQYPAPRLFHAFGLPLILPDDASAELMSPQHPS